MVEDLKKMLEVYEDLVKMDPALAAALANIRRAGLLNDANTVARGLYTDTMIPKMGNKMAYTEFRDKNANSGTHVHVDMNDFGQINKYHGEKTGDDAIKRFGTVANEVSRMMGGKSFRNGGDEFKFWFHKPEHAHAFARELRSRLEKEPKVGSNGRLTHNLAASIGIGFNPDHAETALLHAKKQLGDTDVKTGKRVNKHSIGNAPTVIHSLTHEPPPPGWKPSNGKVTSAPKTTPNLAPPGMTFHNPLDSLGKSEEPVDEQKILEILRDAGMHKLSCNDSFSSCNATVRGLIPHLKRAGFRVDHVMATGRVAPLSSGAHPQWKAHYGNGNAQHFTHHVALVNGTTVVDPTGNQFGRGEKLVRPLSDFSSSWSELHALGDDGNWGKMK